MPKCALILWKHTSVTIFSHTHIHTRASRGRGRELEKEDKKLLPSLIFSANLIFILSADGCALFCLPCMSRTSQSTMKITFALLLWAHISVLLCSVLSGRSVCDCVCESHSRIMIRRTCTTATHTKNTTSNGWRTKYEQKSEQSTNDEREKLLRQITIWSGKNGKWRLHGGKRETFRHETLSGEINLLD